MAEIFKKLKCSFIDKILLKLQQEYDWTDIKIEEINRLSAKKESKRIAAAVRRTNKELKDSAFASCDKLQYITDKHADKIRKYEISSYMQSRAVNHSYAKAIFRAIKKGEYEQQKDKLLQDHFAALDALKAKKQAFIDKLKEKEKAFLAANSMTDAQIAKADEEYEKKRAESVAALEKEIALIKEKTAKERDLKIGKVKDKSVKTKARIDALKNKMPVMQSLPDDVLLRVRNLKMYFGGLKAVDDLSFDVKKGEIFGLIGPNGAGKTTVFNCITMFYSCTDGEIYFCNKYNETVDLNRYKVHNVILQGISRTFQNVELVKEVSVLDNLLIACTREFRSGLAVQALGLPMLKREEQALRIKAMQILSFMGIESYAGWLAFGLPYGILKKVEIARALMTNAKLIIMDEPAAGLNDSETAELAQIIKRIRDEFGVTILLVEHDMSLVMSICDNICAISFGKLLAIGNADEIRNNKVVQEAYLGVEEE